MKHKLVYVLTLMSMLLYACATQSAITPESVTSESPAMEASMSLQLTSDAFANGQSIPAKYTCIGKNLSPALAWNEPPARTQSFGLIVDDPDAPMGTWVHWVMFNIPASMRSLQEAFTPAPSSPPRGTP